MFLPIKTDSPLRSVPWMNWAIIVHGGHVGVILNAVAATDSDYASETLVPVEVPVDASAVLEATAVAGTAVATDVGTGEKVLVSCIIIAIAIGSTARTMEFPGIRRPSFTIPTAAPSPEHPIRHRRTRRNRH